MDYLNYLETLKFNTEPDYKKIRKIFVSGIKDAGGSESGPLTFFQSKKSPQKRKNDQKLGHQSPKRKVGRGRKAEKQVKDESENFDDDNSNHEEVFEPIDSKQKASKLDMDDDEHVMDQSDEKVEVKKRGPKEKVSTAPKKRGRPNKINTVVEEDNGLNVERDKTEGTKKGEDEEHNGTTDPYEGYTEAMREVVMKKLQNAKPKGRKANKLPAMDVCMDGFTDSMKELVEKKERTENKKTVRGKKPAPAKNVKADSSDMINRLRVRKNVCYDDQSDSD